MVVIIRGFFGTDRPKSQHTHLLSSGGHLTRLPQGVEEIVSDAPRHSGW